tara:strand:- start:1607 stop:2167 length:561 start_codon:yes stop_codon:yes gene_type:complete
MQPQDDSARNDNIDMEVSSSNEAKTDVISDTRTNAELIREQMLGAEQIAEIELRWEDTFKVAAATGRIALSGPVTQLQAIARELKALEVSDCLRKPKANLSQAHNLSIQMFLDYMKNEQPSEHDILLIKAHRETFMKEAKRCTLTPEQIEEIPDSAIQEGATNFLDEDSNDRIQKIIKRNREENPI